MILDTSSHRSTVAFWLGSRATENSKHKIMEEASEPLWIRIFYYPKKAKCGKLVLNGELSAPACSESSAKVKINPEKTGLFPLSDAKQPSFPWAAALFWLPINKGWLDPYPLPSLLVPGANRYPPPMPPPPVGLRTGVMPRDNLRQAGAFLGGVP